MRRAIPVVAALGVLLVPAIASADCKQTFLPILQAYRHSWETKQYSNEGHPQDPPGISDHKEFFHDDFKIVTGSVVLGDAAKQGSARAVDHIELGWSFWNNIHLHNPDDAPGTYSDPEITECTMPGAKLTKAVVRWRFSADRNLPAGYCSPREFRSHVDVDGTSTFSFKNGRLQGQTLTMDDSLFFTGNDLECPHLEVEPGGNVNGKLTLNNGIPPVGTAVTCLDSRTSGPYPSGATNNQGCYNCSTYNPIFAGAVSLQAQGQTKQCLNPSDGINDLTCNANITGCGSPTITMDATPGLCLVLNFTFPVWPRLVRAWRRFARTRKVRG